MQCCFSFCSIGSVISATKMRTKQFLVHHPSYLSVAFSFIVYASPVAQPFWFGEKGGGRSFVLVGLQRITRTK